jgi:hypothetical protein
MIVLVLFLLLPFAVFKVLLLAVVASLRGDA